MELPSVSRSSDRLARVQTPVIPQIAELIRANPGCISLGQGVAWYGPPPQVGAAVRCFGNELSQHRYGPAQGIPALIDRISRKLLLENGVPVVAGQRRIIVTAGANMAFLNAILAITDPSDEVILPSPYYFNQEMALTMLNCVPVTVPTGHCYQLELSAIEAAITPKTRAIVTISPNNPSGAVYPPATLQAVNRLCRDRGIYHITDEAYENFLYGSASHFSPASIEGSEANTISLFSLSKAYGFASWRVGYMVIPEHLNSAVLKIQDTNLICAPMISQHAAMAALDVGSAYCRSHLEVLKEVRATVLEELDKIGHFAHVPEVSGAFYLLLHIDTRSDAMTLAERLIREHGVAVIPGTAFGLYDGCYIRVSYGALDRATAVDGTRRLAHGLREICRA